jgi:uncharacterized membrane protein
MPVLRRSCESVVAMMETQAVTTVDGAPRVAGRFLLGLALTWAGVTHLFVAPAEFVAQVPAWFPIDADRVVLVSGVTEIGLGLALLGLRRRRHAVGWLVALFFIVIFPGNVAQWLDGTDAFGLDTDTKRFARLFFQPVLIAWALWSTGAWHARSQRDVA